MDFQDFMLRNFLPEAAAAKVVTGAASLLTAARSANIFTAHVVVGFRPDYPEINPRNRVFSWLKNSGLVDPAGNGTAIHPSLVPSGNELVVTKHRAGAFTGTDLEMILRSQGVDTLILAGITTAGVVLSTVRQAFDQDYNIIVAKDGCADSDDEVHTFLLNKVISQHASVSSIDEIITAMSTVHRQRS
jgi:nicotinamidase-related amidase